MNLLDKKLFIISEIGSVHDGSFGNALKLIDLSKKSGADAVKFQYHIAEEETIKKAPNPSYFKSESRFNYFKRTEFSIEQFLALKKYSKNKGLYFGVSPFSIKSFKNLEKINIDFYKIASGEVTNHLLLRNISKTNKPIFLSTGMSDWKEISNALNIFRKIKKNIVLMQCTSEYPCKYKNAGLNVIPEIKKRFKGLKIGFSDHTDCIGIAAGAYCLGANFIEKHITFSKEMYGSDAKNSLDGNEFSKFCKELRSLHECLKNSINKDDISRFKNFKKIFQKSIYLSKNKNKNEKIKLSDLSFKKPNKGLCASEYKSILGKKIIKKLKKDTLLKKKYVY